MAPLLHLDHGLNVTVEGGGAVDALGELWWVDACGNWWCPPGYSHDSPKAFRPFLFRIDHSEDVTVRNLAMRTCAFSVDHPFLRISQRHAAMPCCATHTVRCALRTTKPRGIAMAIK